MNALQLVAISLLSGTTAALTSALIASWMKARGVLERIDSNLAHSAVPSHVRLIRSDTLDGTGA